MANRNRREHPNSINFDIFPINSLAVDYFSHWRNRERKKKKTQKWNKIRTSHLYKIYENELWSACSFTSASFATHVSLLVYLFFSLCLFPLLVFMCAFFLLFVHFTGSRSRTNTTLTKTLLMILSAWFLVNVVEFRCKIEWLADEHNSMNITMADEPQQQ